MRYVVMQTVFFALLLAAVLTGAGRPLLPTRPALIWLGAALCVAAAVLAFVAFRTLGGAFRVAPKPREGSELVVHGVYAHLRHPMYTAVMLLVGGLFLMQPTWIVGVLTIANVVLYHMKARYEERLLLERHAGYAAYRERTYGVVPLRWKT